MTARPARLRSQQDLARAVRRDAHDRVEKVGHGIQVSLHVEGEVVEPERDVHTAGTGRPIRFDAEGHDVSAARDGDVDLIMEDLQAIRPGNPGGGSGGCCSSGSAVQTSAGLWPSEWTRQTSARAMSAT